MSPSGAPATQASLAGLIDLRGRTAIVTGGAMGIGLGIALRLAEAGARLVLADRDREAAEAAVIEVGHKGHGEALAVQQARITGRTLKAVVHIPAGEHGVTRSDLYWTPETPHLIDVAATLISATGDEVDHIQSYFGLRTVGFDRGRFLLNDRPTFLRSVLQQGFWPESHLTAPSPEAIRREVELIKALGFNAARIHQKVEDPRFIYWCDKLGLMLWGEMAAAYDYSPGLVDRFTREWLSVVDRDRSNPSIVTWVPLNESWGVPLINKGHAGQYAFVERAVRTTRLFDFYRPVIDNDGWDHTDVTDICTIHDYTSSGDGVRERYAETAQGGALPERTWWDGGLTFVEGSGYHGQPVMLTEVGGFLIKPFWLPKEQWDVLYATYGSVDDTDELLAKIEDLMSAIASLPFVSGFCYTQLTDVEQEINGLTTYDRKPKVPIERIREINDSLRRHPSVVPQEF